MPTYLHMAYAASLLHSRHAWRRLLHAPAFAASALHVLHLMSRLVSLILQAPLAKKRSSQGKPHMCLYSAFAAMQGWRAMTQVSQAQLIQLYVVDLVALGQRALAQPPHLHAQKWVPA